MARKFLTGIDLSGQKATGLADGTNPSDAVTKAQLDAQARGLQWKVSCRAATTTNTTLSGTQTIDGVALSAGHRVLVKDQSTGATNGIYVVAAGAWTRAVDADESTEVTASMAVGVEQGTVNGDKVFVLATDGPITIGTTSLSFTAIGGSGVSYTAGNGLNLSGSAFAVVAGSGIIADGTSTRIDPAYPGLAKRFSQDVPAGSTTATITHNLGTKDVTIRVREVATDQTVEVDEATPTTNTATLGFATAPTSGQYRVTITG